MIYQLDATFGTFLSTRLDMRLAGTWRDFDQQSVKAGKLATYVHEHVHFHQTIFTGYGHIQWDGHRQLTGYIVSEWKKLVASRFGKLRLPLAHLARIKELEGDSRSIFEMSLEQIRLAKARFYMEYGTATPNDLGSILIKKDWPSNPVIEIDGKQRALQTKDILEGHAHFVERTFLERSAEVEHDIAWNRDGLPDQYTAAYDWFIQECGEVRRDEFPVLCDLALQTSWRPVVPTTEQQWRDSNPAWRFFTLVRALAVEKYLTLGLPERWPIYYVGFASKLLGICKLPQLAEIWNERLDAFERQKGLMGIQHLMKEAIEYRQRMPWCAANPATDPPLLEEMMKKFKAPFVVVGGQMGSFGEPSIPGSEIIFELQYQALAAQILGDVSSAARESGSLECAFGKYSIPQGCPYQATHGCIGRFKPEDGAPHPATIVDNDQIIGCSFEALMVTAGIKCEDLDIDWAAKFEPWAQLVARHNGAEQ